MGEAKRRKKLDPNYGKPGRSGSGGRDRSGFAGEGGAAILGETGDPRYGKITLLEVLNSSNPTSEFWRLAQNLVPQGLADQIFLDIESGRCEPDPLETEGGSANWPYGMRCILNHRLARHFSREAISSAEAASTLTAPPHVAFTNMIKLFAFAVMEAAARWDKQLEQGETEIELSA